MYNIQSYYEAETLAEALELLVQKPSLKVIAGGTDLLVQLHHGRIPQVDLLSIRKLRELAGIQLLTAGEIVLGSLVTFSDLVNHQLIKQHIPVLAEAALAMGGPQIRHIATLGGNICNGATSADSAPALFALNAQLKLTSRSGERLVPIREFYLGPGKVDIRAGEILAAIVLNPEDYRGFSGEYIKFAMRQAMDIATLGVAVLCRFTAGQVLEDLRIALGVAGPTPLRCSAAEDFARGKVLSAENIAAICELTVEASRARTSWRASKEYREHLIKELTQRALTSARAKAVKQVSLDAGGGEIV